MKQLQGIYSTLEEHWVGDGFPVKRLFSYQMLADKVSPFLLLDYAGPAEFAPAERQRGVGMHPHRGFQTVTFAYQGEVAHQDSAGNNGIIRLGDIQWMTAGSGVMHEELHSEHFTRCGGTLEMAQLWVNLPAKYKMTAPKYQAIVDRDIPSIDLPDNAGYMRIIAGEYNGRTGPAHTFTPLSVWDVRLAKGGNSEFTMIEGWNTVLAVLSGKVLINNKSAEIAQTVLFNPQGTQVKIQAEEDSVLLLLSGEPIMEPIAGQGPFVMNTREEIAQALADYNSGHFG